MRNCGLCMIYIQKDETELCYWLVHGNMKNNRIRYVREFSFINWGDNVN